VKAKGNIIEFTLPGSVVLTLPGSSHKVENDGDSELKLFVACVKNMQ
jgi:hypothetical protein